MTTDNEIKQCSACGEDIKAIAKKCKHCGEMQKQPKQPDPEFKTCSSCGEEIKFIAKKCKHCGDEVAKKFKMKPINLPDNSGVIEELKRNKFLWSMVFYLLLWSMLELAIGIPITNFGVFLPLMALGMLDYKATEKKGLTPPHRAWAVLLQPVYIWKRLNIIKDTKKIVFWVFISTVIITSIIQPDDTIEMIRSGAKSALNTEILPRFNSSIKCKTITKIRESKSSSGLSIEGRHDYKAIAHLSNGNEVRILIVVRDGSDDIYVELKQ